MAMIKSSGKTPKNLYPEIKKAVKKHYKKLKKINKKLKVVKRAWKEYT
jgi:hypothetical protein